MTKIDFLEGTVMSKALRDKIAHQIVAEVRKLPQTSIQEYDKLARLLESYDELNKE